MESHNIILFLLNNGILEKGDFQSDTFSLEKEGESNLTFYLNSLKNQDEHVSDNEDEAFFAEKFHGAWIIKVKQNINNLSDNLLVREALFFDIFKNLKLFNHFPEAHSKSSLGLFQNNTIVVRQFVENYRDAYRILLNRKNTQKDYVTFLDELIKNTAKALLNFHNTNIDIIIDVIKGQFAEYLNPGELNINPIFLQAIPPPNKYKLAPIHIQFFWLWVNNKNNKENIQKLIDDSNYEKQSNQLVHGDFRLPNILFSLEGRDKEELITTKKIKPYKINFDSPLFIDFEYWHLGDQTWDLACFFQNLKLSIPNNWSRYKKIFLDEYYGSKLTDKITAKIEATEKLLMIQNVYAELNEANYVAKIQELSKMIKL